MKADVLEALSGTAFWGFVVVACAVALIHGFFPKKLGCPGCIFCMSSKDWRP